MTQEVEALYDRVAELTKENGQLEVEVKALEETRDKLVEERDDLKDQAKALTTQVDSRDSEITELHEKVEWQNNREVIRLPMDTLYIGLEKGNLVYQEAVDGFVRFLRNL